MAVQVQEDVNPAVCHGRRAAQPSVSAIITAFNGEQFIADAIESVLQQTRPVNEVVVVDDGSTDGTASIAEGYRSRGVRLIRQDNRGASEARNHGIAKTSGELIAFLDCDDLWAPEKTELQVQGLLENEDVGGITCDAWWWDVQNGQRYVKRLRIGSTNGAIRRRLAVRNFCGNASGMMVRRRVLEAVGVFNPAEFFSEDWDMWRRVGSRFRIAIVRHPLIVYRVVPTGLSHQRLAERGDAYYASARIAIRSQKVFWRPLLILQALAWREYFRSVYVRDQKLFRRRYLLHASVAFLCWPFEETGDRLRLLARALLGERFHAAYNFLRRRLTPRNASS